MTQRSRLLALSCALSIFPVATASLLYGEEAHAGTASPAAPVKTPPSTPRPAEEKEEHHGGSNALLNKVAGLVQSGNWMTEESFRKQLQTPTPGEIALLPPATKSLRRRDVAQKALRSYLRVGWYYHCSKCGQWHLNLAGGYAIAKNTLVTAYHVAQSPETMRPGEGYPVIVRGEDEVIPVTGVLAANQELDAVVLRAGVADLTPLALSGDVEVGDDVYCLSDPRGVRGYFSNGVVNRIFPVRGDNRKDFRLMRLNVSTDWAPGSSGSAVLDNCGNVVGHVARIQPFMNTGPSNGPAATTNHQPGARATYMNLHEAIPAKSVLELIKSATPSP